MPLNCGHISFRPRSHRAQKRLSLSLQLSSTFKACFVTTALRQYYPRLLIHYYFEHRVKVNLVSLDAVTHFVTHCLLCTDRHFIFKYSACHFHDTKRSAHFFMTRTRAVPDADLPLEFHEPPASPDPSSEASDSTLSTPSSSPLSSPSTSPGPSPGRSEWTSNPPTPSFEINADDEKDCFILYADDGVEECPATPPRTGRRLAKSSPPRLFSVG